MILKIFMGESILRFFTRHVNGRDSEKFKYEICFYVFETMCERVVTLLSWFLFKFFTVPQLLPPMSVILYIIFYACESR